MVADDHEIGAARERHEYEAGQRSRPDVERPQQFALGLGDPSAVAAFRLPDFEVRDVVRSVNRPAGQVSRDPRRQQWVPAT